MWISVQTKGCKISPRMRNNIERYVRRALRRQERQIASVHVTISTTMVGGASGFRCRLRIWSHLLGVIVVSDIGDTLRSATQQATQAARKVVWRRVHKRISKKRRIPHSRFDRWSFAAATVDGASTLEENL